MLSQKFEPIEAEDFRASEQDVQAYFEHRLWSEFCCETQIEELYMNIIRKKLIYEVDFEAITIIYNNK